VIGGRDGCEGDAVSPDQSDVVYVRKYHDFENDKTILWKTFVGWKVRRGWRDYQRIWINRDNSDKLLRCLEPIRGAGESVVVTCGRSRPETVGYKPANRAVLHVTTRSNGSLLQV